MVDLREGQRVRMSKLALERKLVRRRHGKYIDTGVVTGFSYRNPDVVWVRLDGNKSSASWHKDFWEIDRRRKK